MEGAMGGACSIDGDWDSICRMLSMDQDSDFVNLLHHSSNNYDRLLEDDDEGSVISLLMAGDSSPNYFNVDLHSLPHMSCISSTNYDPLITSYSTINDPMNIINAGELKTEDEFATLQPKKRARIPKDHALKGKRKVRAKKVRDVDEGVGEEEEDNKKSTNRNAASDDEYINNSQEGIKGKSDDTGMKRAGRGAATDPQSLYARKRRERINERLRILQTLVPNGTKVDISTMLEEAVHYVKFLQTQIKLLSSEEMWMYAPLAYNGIDVGLYNNFSAYVLP